MRTAVARRGVSTILAAILVADFAGLKPTSDPASIAAEPLIGVVIGIVEDHALLGHLQVVVHGRQRFGVTALQRFLLVGGVDRRCAGDFE